MPKGRLLAFSDGVLAILITIMVLELHTPDGVGWSDLRDEVPTLLAYVLSFAFIGIYWNNHHHLLTAVQKVSGAALWANLHLLFWLSLVPFVTAWMSENDFPPVPVAVYGISLLMSGVAYLILQTTLERAEGEGSLVAQAVGNDRKGRGTAAIYALGIGLSFVDRWLGLACYVAVAIVWFVPDRRIERVLSDADQLAE